MTGLRVTWPITDPGTPLAQLLHHATADAAAALHHHHVTPAGPWTWTLTRPHGRGLLLAVDIPLSAPRGLAPCGSHAAHNRHRAHGEPPCGLCTDAERAYQADRHRRRRAAPSEEDAA